MALPRAREAREFYRAGRQRFEDARFLLDRAERTTGAVYLAGYGAECLLKALILSRRPTSEQKSIVAEFRGSRAHSIEWLKSLLLQGGEKFPREMSNAFTIVNTWDTSYRYYSGLIPVGEAQEFLRAVQQIVDWADGRM